MYTKGNVMKPIGLTTLKTEELKLLLQRIYRDEVEFPLNAQRIACAGFQYKQDALMFALRDLDKRAVTTVVVCVLAERHAQKEQMDKLRQQLS